VSEILVFDKGGRDGRRALAAEGRTPREFGYGVPDLRSRGYDIKEIATNTAYGGPLGKIHRVVELSWSHLTHLGLRVHLVHDLKDELRLARVAISFIDGFSVTLGHCLYRAREEAPVLVGCFHGLSDLEFKAPALARPLVRRIIRRALQRLDHVAFFGPADRDFAIERYGLARDKTAMILFGVDTDFWRPSDLPEEDYVFSIGQDTNRDFATLVNAPVDLPIHVHTALSVHVPPNRRNVTVTHGSFQRSSLTDEEVRARYQGAIAVVVPLKDVYQPAGYSVTLQAMACGKAVILSRNRGLWDPALLRDGENCLLVPPGDTAAMAAAIERLAADRALRVRLGQAARETTLRHFNLAAGAASTECLIRLGLATWEAARAVVPAASTAF
jgi:glycosyltransferase involved in cell wall biosynthesis